MVKPKMKLQKLLKAGNFKKLNTLKSTKNILSTFFML